jgi:hypothetical protein
MGGSHDIAPVLDKYDKKFIDEYSKENGYNPAVFTKFLNDYYLHCMYRKIRDLDKFCLGGMLRIYKYVYVNRLVKKTRCRWEFYKKYYDFRCYPTYFTEWTRKYTEVVKEPLEKHQIRDKCEELARKHDELL